MVLVNASAPCVPPFGVPEDAVLDQDVAHWQAATRAIVVEAFVPGDDLDVADDHPKGKP
jgi:hypothetical protein